MVNVALHSSQFPDPVRRSLLDSLRQRRVNHKFHYDSYKQARKWLALHEAHSPARTDPDCLAIYDHSFAAAAKSIGNTGVHVIGLGCGGGQKDAQLLRLLVEQGKTVTYAPCDVSMPLVLTAWELAGTVIPKTHCRPMVFDLAEAEDIHLNFDNHNHKAARLVTFFGMIPNFEPSVILPRLAALVRPGDALLFSANLAPGPDYAAGVRQVLPGYDNPLTADWLFTFLSDLGVELSDGEIRFAVEDGESGLKRIVADFIFAKNRSIKVEGESFGFVAGEKIRLFFSYRYTPDRVTTILAQHDLSVKNQWITKSGEEGVFLCQKD